MEYASNYLNMDLISICSTIVLNPSLPDSLIWKGSNSGKFVSGVHWEYTRSKFPLVHWHKHIRNAWLPPKIAMFMWKLLHNAVPVDERMKKLNIHIVSKFFLLHIPSV